MRWPPPDADAPLDADGSLPGPEVPAPPDVAPPEDEPLPDALAIVPVTWTRLFTCDDSSDALPSSV
jgi:hypothetical protein